MLPCDTVYTFDFIVLGLAFLFSYSAILWDQVTLYILLQQHLVEYCICLCSQFIPSAHPDCFNLEETVAGTLRNVLSCHHKATKPK